MPPRYQALAAGKTRPKNLNWSEDMTNAVEAYKEALADVTMLHQPVQGAPTALTSDASDTALVAVLEQKPEMPRNCWPSLAAS